MSDFNNAINDEGSFFTLRSSMNTNIESFQNIDSFQNLEKGFISYTTSTTKDDDGPKMRSVWNALFNLPEVTQAIACRKVSITRVYTRIQRTLFELCTCGFSPFTFSFVDTAPVPPPPNSFYLVERSSSL
jgi:hypothetical protein